MRWPGARVAGVGAVVLALLALWEALGYRVRFLTDPVGPRGLPILAAGIVLVAGLILAIRPGPPEESADPGKRADGADGGDGGEGGRGLDGPPTSAAPGNPDEVGDGNEGGPLGAVIIAGLLLAYSVALPWLGFVLATSLVLLGLARVFRAPWGPGAVAGLVLSVGLWVLFQTGLGIALPVGTLWTGMGL